MYMCDMRLRAEIKFLRRTAVKKWAAHLNADSGHHEENAKLNQRRPLNNIQITSNFFVKSATSLPVMKKDMHNTYRKNLTDLASKV